MSDTAVPQEANDPVISIGVLAERVGLSVSAVRKYENEGLVIAHRTSSGHRLFSHEDIDRVRNIHRTIQDVGLNIEAIRRMQALLPCWDLLPCTEECRGVQNCVAREYDILHKHALNGRYPFNFQATVSHLPSKSR